MNERRLIVSMRIVVALAALANSAFASLEVETAYYGSSSSPLAIGSSEILSLNKFDAGDGTLTGVTIQLFSYDTISSVVFNATGNKADYSEATAKMPVTVTATYALDASDGLTTTATGTAGPFAGTSTGNGPVAVGTSSVIFGRNTISPRSFQPYEAEGGGQFTFTVAVADSVGSYSGMGGSSLFFGGNGYSYGSVEIEYSYDSSGDSDPPNLLNAGDPVPEPGTLCAGLALISIGGIEIARRFRRVPARA